VFGWGSDFGGVSPPKIFGTDDSRTSLAGNQSGLFLANPYYSPPKQKGDYLLSGRLVISANFLTKENNSN